MAAGARAPAPAAAAAAAAARTFPQCAWQTTTTRFRQRASPSAHTSPATRPASWCAPPRPAPPLRYTAPPCRAPARAERARRGQVWRAGGTREPRGEVHDSCFAQAPAWVPRGALLVLNDSRVIAARLPAYKQGTGARHRAPASCAARRPAATR